MASKRARTNEGGDSNCANCADWQAKFEQLQVKCNQIEAECDRWQSDYETLKVEYGAYESDIKAWSDEELEQKIGKFILDPSKQLSKNELKEQLRRFEKIVKDAKESEDDKTSHLFNAFGRLILAYQREYFFYLIAAKTNSDYLMDTSNKYAGNVAPLEWIRVILSICESASVVISENGCFGSAIDGQRARVLIVLRNGTKYSPYSAQIVCGLLYGFATLKGRNASHRCGNATCLYCLFPESWAKNIDRDFCHTGEQEICCHDYALCRPSLKFGTSGSLGSVFGTLNALLISELDNFEQKSKCVVVFDYRKYKNPSMSSGYNFYCDIDRKLKCPGKIRIKDGYLTIISNHDTNCLTLTEKQAVVDATKTVIQLSNSNYKSEVYRRETKLYIWIGGRKFSKTDDGQTYDKWTCTLHGRAKCRVYFERKLDTGDEYGRAIFTTAKMTHSSKCNEKYASDSDSD